MADTATITLDDRATEAIRSLLDEEGYDPDDAGVRLSVERGGCAGFVYDLSLAAAPDPDDVVDERDGVRVFVDAASEPYLEGAELALESTAHGTGFVVENPNADRECGCGLSFG